MPLAAGSNIRNRACALRSGQLFFRIRRKRAAIASRRSTSKPVLSFEPRLRAADETMYRARQQGGGRLVSAGSAPTDFMRGFGAEPSMKSVDSDAGMGTCSHGTKQMCPWSLRARQP